MAEQVIARQSVGQVARPRTSQSVGVVVFVLLGLVLFMLRVWLRTAPATMWTGLEQSGQGSLLALLQGLQYAMPALAIGWTVASFAVVEAIYARIPAYE